MLTLREFWLKECEIYRLQLTVAAFGSKKNMVELHILPELGDKLLNKIDPTDCEKLQLTLLKANLAAATVRQIMAYMTSMLNRAKRQKRIKENPMEAVDLVKVRTANQHSTYLSREEMAEYLAAANREGPTWGTIALCALHTGLRRGEILALKWQDVDLNNRTITVRNSRTVDPSTGDVTEGAPKSGKIRHVGMTVELASAFKFLPSRSQGNYVFILKNGAPWYPDYVRPYHQRTLKAANIERRVRFHDLRHTWASHLAMAGIPLSHIQILGGWSSSAMVQRYAHISSESVLRSNDKLSSQSQPTTGSLYRIMRLLTKKRRVEPKGIEPSTS